MKKLFARCFTAGSVLAVAIASGCSGAVTNPDDTSAIITGKITDNTGLPVVGVRLHLVSNLDIADVRSDTAGVYSFNSMPAGDYTMSLAKPPNYTVPATVTNPRNISVAASSTNTFNYSLVRAPGSAGGPVQWSITIKDYFFLDTDITVPKGTTITWQSYGGDTHSVNSEAGEVMSSGTMRKGARYTHSFNTPGIYQYHCIYHPDVMFGIIRVVDSD